VGCKTAAVSFTLVSFHAHPDDEALLTGGTLARATAEGHRVVLVVATSGEAGLTGPEAPGTAALGERRAAELARSAAALGCARVEILGYPDSGSDRGLRSATGPTRFADLDPDVPAVRLAEILREESADVLTVYDEHGGYGHPDHVQVHRVGVRAAELAGTPVVLEATVDRSRLQRVAAVMARLPGLAGLIPPDRFRSAYLPRAQLTHEVDVRRHLRAKKSALAAHRSQATGGAGPRTVAVLLRLPSPLLRLVLGREWFRERGRAPVAPLVDDVFASLR
jgi:LmbE family N-acetylglucosaminyl deacetylase